MNDYTPRPGSAAEKAVEFIRKRGGTARSAEIAAEIGVEAKQISGALSACVENGLLLACDIVAPGKPPQKEYRISGTGKPVTWREPKPATLSPSPSPASGRGDRPAAAQEAAKPARKPRKPAKPAKPHPRGASRPKVTGRLLRAAEEGRQKNAKRPAVAEQTSDGFRCGIFSDGSLELQFGDGEYVSLTPADTRVLFEYLDKTLQVAA